MADGGTLTIETGVVTVDSRGSATPQDDEIRPGDYVSLSVRDTGHGMPPAVLQRAFEPFFTTKPSGKGTGLGLSMVYGLVKQSGGSIRAASEPGRGTAIEIFLPLVAPPEPVAPAGPPAEPPPASARVLVVEDDPLVRSVVLRELSAQGYRVVEAPDGRAALELLGKVAEPFDLLITDLAMPRMDGRELAQRASAVRPGLPVLFMSGHPDETTRRELSEGEQRYLQKPFTAEELLARLEEMLGRVR
jgi:CheY-like chemotaxis protein